MPYYNPKIPTPKISAVSLPSATDLRIRTLEDRLELMDALGKKGSPLYRKISRDLETLRKGTGENENDS